MQIDKVVRKMGLGFKKVFSLVANEQNIYIIWTGNVGGLPKAFDHLGGGAVSASHGVGGVLGAAAATPIIRKFQEELASGEKKLADQGPDALVSDNKKNAKIPFNEITKIDFQDKKQPELNIDSSQGKFSFIFQVNNPAKVSEFVSMLKQKTSN